MHAHPSAITSSHFTYYCKVFTTCTHAVLKCSLAITLTTCQGADAQPTRLSILLYEELVVRKMQGCSPALNSVILPPKSLIKQSTLAQELVNQSILAHTLTQLSTLAHKLIKQSPLPL